MNEISCQELAELVTAYLDGALDAESERRVSGHLAGCSGCTCYLDQFQRTIHSLRKIAVRTVPDQVRQSCLNAFRDGS